MSVKLRYCLVILLLGNIFLLPAQTQLKGVVEDSLGNKLSFINILVKPRNSEAISSFTYTDADGKYSITLNRFGALVISYKGMSFQEKQLILEIDSIEPPPEIIENIVLREEVFQMEEVVVNADIPIVVKEDTIVLNTASFVNGTEDVVEDVLRKLPGISVSSDGIVKVNGQLIDRILVEGDDLFEKGYQILTKNLNADMVNKVEILQNYSDNILLKNIEDSDRTALNITLKEDRKSTLFGNAQAGYGTEEFYSSKLNLISFNEKTKIYFFGNMNNTGSDATGDIFQIIYPEVINSETYIGDGESAPTLVSMGAFTPGLKGARSNFNDAELASINAIYSPVENLKIKGLLFFSGDEQDFYRDSEQNFLTETTRFQNSESYSLTKRSTTLNGKLDGIYTITPDFQIEYVGRFSLGHFHDSAKVVFNRTDFTESVETDLKKIDQRFNITKRINDRRALQLTGRYIYDRKPQDFRVDNYLFQELFPELPQMQTAEQAAETSVEFFGFEGRYIYNTTRHNFDVKAGITGKDEVLISRLHFEDYHNIRYSAPLNFNNDSRLNYHRLYANANYKYSLDNFMLRIGMDAYQLFYDIGQVDYSFMNLNPSASMTWSINNNNKILVSYRYRNKDLELSELYPNFLLTSYNSFERGLGKYEHLSGSSLLVNYSLGNWSDSFLANLSVIYQNDHKYLSTNRQVSPVFTLSSPLVLNGKQLLSANIGIDKFIDGISSNIKIKSGYSKNQYHNIVNSEDLRAINASTVTYGGEWRSAFTGGFNFHLGTEWSSSKIAAYQESWVHDNNSFLDLLFDISDRFAVEMKNEFYYFSEVADGKTNFLSDIEADYKLIRNKLSLKASAMNIFNKRYFSQKFINDVGSYRSTYRLLPRYLFLELNYRF